MDDAGTQLFGELKTSLDENGACVASVELELVHNEVLLPGSVSKHAVAVCHFVRNGLQHIPMLDNFAVFIQPENINSCVIRKARPCLAAVQQIGRAHV